MSNKRAVVVDLDGTLIDTDILWESLVLFAKQYPSKCIELFSWLFKGRAFLKRRLADHVTPDVSVLPYSEKVINFIKQSKAEKREIILASASDERVVKKIALHLGLFDEAVGSTENINLKSEKKLKKIIELCDGKEFDYIGNEDADIPLWNASKNAYIYTHSNKLVNRVTKKKDEIHLLESTRPDIWLFLKAFRVHQWIKNILVFVPLFLAHDFSFSKIIVLSIAFFALSLGASSVYILNDIMDIEADRHHKLKRKRPFASGRLSIPNGLLISFALLVSSCLISIISLPGKFSAILLFYFFLTTFYSLFLKRTLLLDVITLSGLYSLRLFAGGVAVTIPLSHWFLSFSSFFFLNLAFLKRFIELYDSDSFTLKGRNYSKDDTHTIQISGIVCGYMSVLVFYLYISNSDTVNELYLHKGWLWFIGPLLVYWLTRIWILAQRKQVHSDPIIFAIKDIVSWSVFILSVAIVLIGTM